MKVQVKDRVIDLNLVEEIFYHEMVFSITLNNGRQLDFHPEKVEIEPLITGTPQELDSFIQMKKDRSMSAERVDLKDLYYTDKGNRDGGKYVLNLYDKKEKDRLLGESRAELKSLYDKFSSSWGAFKNENVNQL